MASSSCAGVYKCKVKKCMCCDFLGLKKTFHSTKTKDSYKFHSVLSCKTSNVIYIIQCKKCPAQYVGKTVSALRVRFGALKRSIANKERGSLSDHFNNNGHTLKDVEIVPIEHVVDTQQLKERELYWIEKLQTLEHGQNLEPYKAGRRQDNDGDDNEDDQVEQYKASATPHVPGKRKHGNDHHGDTKKQKRLKNTISNETIDLRLYDIEKIKRIVAQVNQKLETFSCKKDAKFLENLREKIKELQVRTISEKIYIGLFGKTGAGKSSLINAIVDEDWLLPSGSMSACTSVLVYVQANTESDKYKAEIEFINKEDWEADLRFLVETLANENDTDHTDDDEDDLFKMAEDKITAIYGKEGLDKSFDELMRIRDGPDIPESGRKTLQAKSAEDLSNKISCYIRSDPINRNQVQYWPLVKRVTISLPNSPALLENVVLVDLPGAGDANKHRDEMWKQCISQCASIWIISEVNRGLSEKEATQIFNSSLKDIAGGGECHNITYICTKTDTINVMEFKRNHKIGDKDLNINVHKDSPEYEKKVKQACILYGNDKLKNSINNSHKARVEQHLLGEVQNSDSYFTVFTVSSDEYKAIKQEGESTISLKETELPDLIEHIRKISESHLIRDVKDYTAEVTGIVSLLNLSKMPCDKKIERFNEVEFIRLKKEVKNMCRTLETMLHVSGIELQSMLEKGMEEANKNHLTNANKVLKRGDNRGRHQMLKALCKNDGYHRCTSREIVDLNFTLTEPLYRQIDDKFVKLFGLSCSGRSSLKGKLESFLHDLIKVDYYKQEPAKYLRLLYIKTEQRKIIRNLEKKILQKKKSIYNSLSDTVQGHMQSTYQECYQVTGKGLLKITEQKLKDKIKTSGRVMFQDAVSTFHRKFTELKKEIVGELESRMELSLMVALNQVPTHLTTLPDFKEEFDLMKEHCDALKLRIFV